MKSRDFCYWLQGFFEIAGSDHSTLDKNQITIIKKHLSLVFEHEIDPSMGSPEHQKKLNQIHHPNSNKDTLIRC